MTDEEFDRAKARVERIIAKWEKHIGIGWWHMTYKWLREPCKENDSHGEVVMETNSDWTYRWATIKVYLPSLPDDDEDLERDLVHEYMHVLLGPEQQQLKHDEHSQYVESATHNVTLATLWARQAGDEDAVERIASVSG